MTHICTDDSINMGLTQEELRFFHWCPYCDEVTNWQWRTIHDTYPYCRKCEWNPSYDDNFPKGLDPKTGELIDETQTMA